MRFRVSQTPINGETGRTRNVSIQALAGTGVTNPYQRGDRSDPVPCNPHPTRPVEAFRRNLSPNSRYGAHFNRPCPKKQREAA